MGLLEYRKADKRCGAAMARKRKWILVAITAVCATAIAFFVALESGVFVQWMNSPSDWVPEPMVDLEVRCDTRSEPVPWSYCVHRQPRSRSRDLVVHFHGRRGTERWWNDKTYYTGELYEHWRDAGVDAPTVVSVSFGPLWVLTGETGEAFKHDVLAEARTEAQEWAGHTFDRQHLVGESMGGYNALLTAFDAELGFDRIAALCPPLSERSPFGRGVMARITESSPREAFMLLAFSRAFFEDEDDWRATDPVARALAGERPQSELLLTCGEHDPWGCLAGGRALTDAIQANGGEAEWVVLPEGHCAIDTERVAEFLIARED